MTVESIIEQWVKAGNEDIVWDMLRYTRAEAVRTRGYIYGETWRSIDNPQGLFGPKRAGVYRPLEELV